MADITQEKLKYYYDKAQKAKEGITEKYNDVLNYTNVSYTISEEKNENTDTREIEEVVSESITTLVNFVMSNVFPRGLRWASLEINETLYNQGNGEAGQISNQNNIQKINGDLETVSDTFFDFLNNSNFYTEAAKAVRDASVLGTGVVKIIEQEDTQRPFLYKYQNLDGFYFLENVFGEPNICFKSIFELTKEDITELYGKQAAIPEKAAEDNKTIDLIECVVPNPDDSKIFNFMVYDAGFETLVFEAKLKYNPFVVFRWALEGNSIWGIGLGILALKLFKDLENFKNLREQQSARIVNPPVSIAGNKILIDQIKFEPGHINYGGSLMNSGMDMGFDGFKVDPMLTSQSLIPVDQDIAITKSEIKSLFMSNPLGDLAEGKNRSATEVQARMQLFRSRWSGSYELMQQEFMKPTFMAPLMILIEKSIVTLSFEESDLDFTVIKYENELSRAGDIEKVQMLSTYANSALNLSNVSQQVGLNRERTLKYVQNNLAVPEEIKSSQEEDEAYTKRVQQEQDRLMAEKALGEALQMQGQEINQNEEVENAG